MQGIQMHSVVALLEDLPEHGLMRGQVGTVVESWAPNVYEVEFADESGRHGRTQAGANHPSALRTGAPGGLAVCGVRRPKAADWRHACIGTLSR